MNSLNLLTQTRLIALTNAKERREALPDTSEVADEENGERIIELQNQIERLVESLKIDTLFLN